MSASRGHVHVLSTVTVQLVKLASNFEGPSSFEPGAAV
jgi:hypothetical protein